MSSTQSSHSDDRTPLSNITNTPLTPPATDEEVSPQARRVITLFKDIQAGKSFERQSWIEFRLTPEDYEEVEHQLSRDELLHGFTQNKIRYDYLGQESRLTVRMPTKIHEVFLDHIEDAIRRWLKEIANESNKKGLFAANVRPTRSTTLFFPIDNTLSHTKSQYEPDASFWHKDADWPGIIIEVAYSQNPKSLHRLVENYLLDSDTNIQVVVGLNIEYGRAKSRKATFSVWRARSVHTSNGDELRAISDIEDEAFRDDDGNSTNHPGLRLRLSDCACRSLTEEMIQNGEDCEINVSTRELCRYLAAAEEWAQNRPRRRDYVPPGLKKRKRSETPSETIASDDEAKYTEQEERAAKRAAAEDLEYKPTLIHDSALGQPLTISGTVVSLASSASALVVGPSTIPLSPNTIAPEQLGGPAAIAPIITLGGQPVTANSQGAYVIDSQTMIPDGTPITVSGTVYSLAPSGTALQVGGTMIIHLTTPAPPITLCGQYLTADAQGGYVIGSQTLTPGGPAVTVSGTVVSVAADGQTVVVGGTTEVLASTTSQGIGVLIWSGIGGGATGSSSSTGESGAEASASGVTLFTRVALSAQLGRTWGSWIAMSTPTLVSFTVFCVAL